MDFKIGDKVRPLTFIPVSNKQMMDTRDEGTVIEITRRENGHYMLVVERNYDNEIFMAEEQHWEKA